MKEATGELNMTVVTIIAIGAIIAFFWFMWPTIRGTISKTWDKTTEEQEPGKMNDGKLMSSYIIK